MKKYTIAFLIIIMTIFSCSFSYAKWVYKDEVSPEEWNRIEENYQKRDEEIQRKAKQEQKEANEKFNMLAENKELEEKNNNQQSIIITLAIIIAVLLIGFLINTIRKKIKITIEKKK
jgi:hypothetical protein